MKKTPQCDWLPPRPPPSCAPRPYPPHPALPVRANQLTQVKLNLRQTETQTQELKNSATTTDNSKNSTKPTDLSTKRERERERRNETEAQSRKGIEPGALLAEHLITTRLNRLTWQPFISTWELLFSVSHLALAFNLFQVINALSSLPRSSNRNGGKTTSIISAPPELW